MDYQLYHSEKNISHQIFGSLLLTWDNIKKTKLYALLVFFDIAILMLWITFVHFYDNNQYFTKTESIHTLFWLSLPCFIVLSIFLLFYKNITTFIKHNLIFIQYALMFSHCLHVGFMGHFFGQFNFIVGVSVGATIFWALLLLDRKIAYISLTINIVVLFGSQLLTRHLLGLSYGSAYSDLALINSTFWIISSLFLVLAKIFIIVILGDVIIKLFKERHEKLTYISEHDDLTGLLNRQSILKKACFQLKNNETISFLLLDIDHFKNINDTYGHLAGDVIICSLADLLRKETPNNALISRYGGEEFLIGLIDTDLESAKLIAQKLLTSVSETQFYEKNMGYQSITVSIGISSSIIPPTTNNQLKTINDNECNQFLDTLIHHADTALIEAKKTGRNKWLTTGVIEY